MFQTECIHTRARVCTWLYSGMGFKTPLLLFRQKATRDDDVSGGGDCTYEHSRTCVRGISISMPCAIIINYVPCTMKYSQYLHAVWEMKKSVRLWRTMFRGELVRDSTNEARERSLCERKRNTQKRIMNTPKLQTYMETTLSWRVFALALHLFRLHTLSVGSFRFMGLWHFYFMYF